MWLLELIYVFVFYGWIVAWLVISILLRERD